MRARIFSLPLAALALFSGVSLRATRASAQTTDDTDPIPESEHPGSDSPESVTGSLARMAAGRKRAQAFLIPLDEKARGPTGRVAQAIERALAGARQYEVVDIAKALASDAEPAQEEKAAQGRKLIADGKQSFAAHNYADAIARFKGGIRGLSAGLAALDSREIAEAYLRLAAAQQLSGDQKEARAARDSYLETALLDPQQKVSASSVDPIAEQPLLIARNDLEQIPIGKLQLETRPAGARVFIDGQPQGGTPTAVELTGGKHLLRMERTGFYPTAELVDVASRRDTLYSVTLTATPGAATLNQVIAGAADEAARGRAGEKTGELANRFRLDRVLIGSVSSHGIKVSVLLALADPRTNQLLGRQEMLLVADGTDSDQLDFDTQEAARKLFALDDGPAPPPRNETMPGQQLPPLVDPSTQAPPPEADSTNVDGTPRAVMPQAQAQAQARPAPEPLPTPDPAASDDPGLVTRPRHPVAPAAPPPPEPGASMANDPPAPAPARAQADDTAPVPVPVKEDPPKKKKKKSKDLHAKSGTEGWDGN